MPPQTSTESSAMDTAPAMNNATSSMANVTTTESATLEIQRIDVKDTTISINGLKKDVLYELVVKAGNVYGAYSYLSIASLAQPGLICPLLFSSLPVSLAPSRCRCQRAHRSD